MFCPTCGECDVSVPLNYLVLVEICKTKRTVYYVFLAVCVEQRRYKSMSIGRRQSTISHEPPTVIATPPPPSVRQIWKEPRGGLKNHYRAHVDHYDDNDNDIIPGRGTSPRPRVSGRGETL